MRVTLSAGTSFLVVAGATDWAYWHVVALSAAEQKRRRAYELSSGTLCGLHPAGFWPLVRSVCVGRVARPICPRCLPCVGEEG